MKRGKLTGIDVVKCFFIVAFFGVCLYFVSGELLLPADVPAHEYRCEEFEARMPSVIDNGSYLCFLSLKQSIRIYIDGTLRQEYSTENSRLFGKTGAVAYVFLEL